LRPRSGQRPVPQRRRRRPGRRRARVRHDLRQPELRRRRVQLLHPPGDPADRVGDRARRPQQLHAQPADQQGAGPGELRQPRAAALQRRGGRGADAQGEADHERQLPAVRRHQQHGGGPAGPGDPAGHRVRPERRARVPPAAEPERDLHGRGGRPGPGRRVQGFVLVRDALLGVRGDDVDVL
ncbi:MAG: hypothetical protein AVDCRST_MAG64-3862, partial [uncultured Phycisphaerae bacterium]